MVFVALAGPATNVLLAIISSLLFFGVGLVPQAGQEFLARNLVNSLQINAVLCVFNMLPLPPLDGSHVITSVLPRPLAMRYASFGRYGILVVLALFFILPELAVRLGIDFDPFGWLIGGPAEWLWGVIWRMVGLS